MTKSETVLEIAGATKEYRTNYFLPRLFSRPTGFPALNNVSLSVKKGEVLGIIGESGSGKTTLGKSIVNLTKLDQGDIKLFGEKTNGLSQKKFRPLRKDIQMIFQDLDAALNSNMKTNQIFWEIYRTHYPKQKAQYHKIINEILDDVYLTNSVLNKFPTELSGGQKRRVSIAAVLLVKPKIIIADEPTSGLDAHVQRLIMHLLQKLQRQNGLTLVLISHDLGLVKEICQQIAVMYRGTIVETGSIQKIFHQPTHAYTQQLISAYQQL